MKGQEPTERELLSGTRVTGQFRVPRLFATGPRTSGHVQKVIPLEIQTRLPLGTHHVARYYLMHRPPDLRSLDTLQQ